MNNYFERNYTRESRNNFDSYQPDDDYTDSNSMYDRNVGVTHLLLRSPDGSVRIVSDVEICMTDDPRITSLFSSEQISNLRNAILGKPHNSTSNVDSNDDPIFGSVVPQGIERDELSDLIVSRQEKFHDAAVDNFLSKHSSAQEPSSSSAQEPSSSSAS